MAKALLDIQIEAGYPYPFILDMNDADGVDLETDYSCYFECDSIGQLQFAVVNGATNRYELLISKENTDKLLANLEEYTVYNIKTSDGAYSKLLSGRIHVDNKVRS